MSIMKERLQLDAAMTEAELKKRVGALTLSEDQGKVLGEAMQYSLMIGGKRIRPFLVIEFARMLCGGRVAEERVLEAALPFACAVECIHTYSLIHDDLPCMDDDDMRRGHLSNHKVYGEATALLAGDALLTAAFGIAADNKAVDAGTVLRVVALLSRCAGALGMCGGQQIDLAGEKEALDFDILLSLHDKKTGELIRFSCLAGTLAAVSLLRQLGETVDEADLLRRAELYAKGVGLSFQIVDDILDRVGNAEELGKAVGVDSAHNKTTFMAFMTVEQAREHAARMTVTSVDAIADLDGSVVLTDLAEYLLNRTH